MHHRLEGMSIEPVADTVGSPLGSIGRWMPGGFVSAHRRQPGAAARPGRTPSTRPTTPDRKL